MEENQTLDLSAHLRLPLDIITESSAILGKRGSGKTTAGIVLLEEVYSVGVPVVSIDPKGDHWGVRSGVDGGPGGGLPIPVFGGLHGDIPLEPTAGQFIADLVRERRLSVVLDASEFSTVERRRFLTAFVDRLYRRPEREPMCLVVEEAHEVIPQRVDAGDAPMVGAFERLIKLGRFKGIGVVMLSQRSASLNKNVLTQVDNLFMMRTVSPQDRAAVKAWIDTHSESSAIIDSLPSLATGECWLWQPEHGEPVRFRFRLRRTYDAGSTPKVGEVSAPTATLADIDLGEVESLMVQTIERQKQDDPKALRARIAKLESELATAPNPIEVRVEVPALGQETLDALDDRVTELQSVLADIRAQVEMLERAASQVEGAVHAVRSAPVAPPRQGPVRPGSVPAPAQKALASRAPKPPAVDGGRKLTKAQKAIVTALAVHGTLSQRQIGLHTGYAHKSGSFANALSGLRTRGLIEGTGQSITLTEDGFTVLDENGGYDPLPTGGALVDWWLARLPKAQSTMLNALLAVYPGSLTVEELAEATGYAAGSGSFANNRSRLNVAELIHGTRDALYAADTLGDALAHG
ncbi:helicase HerA-like domain-containing protein [Microbacterium enclense]|uniref:ATP-binding protein n=1 Tax=Microbacterium enclense TaxID=993073 RepID=UPI003F81AC0E